MADGDLIRIKERKKEGMRLGRHIEHDPRSRGFAALATAPPTLKPQNKVWKRHVGPFDQGNLGSCTGNALVGCASTDPSYMRTKRYTEATAVRIYKRATVLDGFTGTYKPDDTGSSGLAASKAIVEAGLATKYLWGFGIDDLVLIVSNIGSCAVGTDWHPGMDSPDSSGLVRLTGASRGGHEWQVLGYHLDTGLGAPISDCFEAQNSWGLSYGVKGTDGKGGRFFIKRVDMGSLLKAGGDCVTLVTDTKPQ